MGYTPAAVGPEILIVGDRLYRGELIPRVQDLGYTVTPVRERELLTRVAQSPNPAAVIVCLGGAETGALVQALRRSRDGASTPVLLYGRLQGEFRDLADVLELGADRFLESPVDVEELAAALTELAGPPEVGPRTRPRAASPGAPAREGRGDPILNQLHRTLEILAARLESREEPADGGGEEIDLEAMGLDAVPDVDPGHAGEVELELLREPTQPFGGRGGPREPEPPVARRHERTEPLARAPKKPPAPTPAREGSRPPDPSPVRQRDVDSPTLRLPKTGRWGGRGEPSGGEISPAGRVREGVEPDAPVRRRDPTGERTAPVATGAREDVRKDRFGREASAGRGEGLSRGTWPEEHDARGRQERGREEAGRAEGLARRTWPERQEVERGREPGDLARGGRGPVGPADETARLPRPGAGRPLVTGAARPRGEDGGREVARGRFRGEDDEVGSRLRGADESRGEDARASRGAREGSRAHGDEGRAAGGSRFRVDDGGAREEPRAHGEEGRAAGGSRFRVDDGVARGAEDEAGRSRVEPRRVPVEEGSVARRERTDRLRVEVRDESGARAQVEDGAAARREQARRLRSEGGDDGSSRLRAEDAEPVRRRVESGARFKVEAGGDSRLRIAEDVEAVTPARRDEAEASSSWRGEDAPTRVSVREVAAEALPPLGEARARGEGDGASVLAQLRRERFTGCLEVRAEDGPRRRLWWSEGQVVGGASASAGESVLGRLSARGLIDAGHLELAGRWSSGDARRDVERLVQAGWIKPQEAQEALREPVRRIVERVAERASVAWSLHPGERAPVAIELGVPLAALIAGGVRRGRTREQLRAAVPDEVRPRLSFAGPEALAAELRWPEAAAIAGRFDGQVRVDELIATAIADEEELRGLVHVLGLLGHLAPPVEDVAASLVALDRRRVRERLRLARETDYFALLGLPRDATRAEVLRAHADLTATFREALEAASRVELAEELAELHAALDEARDVLTDEALHSAYLAQLGEP